MVFAKRTTVTWRLELNVDCPYCDEYQDVIDQFNEQELYLYIKTCESRKLKITHGSEDFVCTCKECNKEFVISKIEF